MTKKHNDLQPWLDYFQMLRTYEQKGLLEVQPEKGEAYVTQPALHALSDGDDPAEQLRSGAVADTLRRIRTYCAYRQAHARGLQDFDPRTANSPDQPLPPVPTDALQAILARPFALHVVKDEPPHDLLYTLLLTPTRSWRTAWRRKEKIEVIDYTGKKE
ncbi:MAG: hypothetical protein IJ551_09740 [Prevotella sp.]|nr:hypothetical protein [Prevotella sp.]